MYSECQELLQGKRFVHMFFELPYTAPSRAPSFVSRPDGSDHIISVTLDSEFAKEFFGEEFVEAYKNYVASLMHN